MDHIALPDSIKTGDVETVILASPDMQGRPYAKRLTAQHFLDVGTNGIGTCSVVLGWGHDHSLDPGYSFTGWDSGYPDMVVQPDMGSVRHYPWFDKTALVVGDPVMGDGGDVTIAPRGMLKTMIKRLADKGLKAAFASELECYLLDETPTSAFDKGFVNLQTKHRTMHPETLMRTSEDEAFLGPLRRNLGIAGIPVEMVKAEYAPGQVEINLRYSSALDAADNHFVFKSGVKEQALQQGLIATFMAKPWHELGGSSCHIHMSLTDHSGNNVFAAGESGQETSDTMRHFLGGMTAYFRDIFLFLAPTVNSYKRLQPNTFAPASVTWGEDNRTVALRLVGSGASRRIENRIPGADVNPYLAYSAMIAAGLKGLEEKLEPIGQQAQGNAYQGDSAPALPATLAEATEAFAKSQFIADTFGPETRDHYANFGIQSVNAAAPIVSDFERRILLMDI